MDSECCVIAVNVNNQDLELGDSKSFNEIDINQNDNKLKTYATCVGDTNNVKTNIEVTEVDGKRNDFASKKNIAEGMMDIALLTANANQLRFLLIYNSHTKTYYLCISLILLSLLLQIIVGLTLIFKRQIKRRCKEHRVDRTSNFLVGGVFLVTVINVFVASFTTTDNVQK